MPRIKTHLTAAEYALLGFLRRRPSHGYELQRRFTGGKGIARVCPVEPAMVYASLKSLAGLELIDGRWDTSSYPPRAVYALTNEGEVALERWLRLPVEDLQRVRSDFLLKLFFVAEHDPRAGEELVLAQIEICRAHVISLEQESSEAEASSFDAVVLGARIAEALMLKDWLVTCLAGFG